MKRLNEIVLICIIVCIAFILRVFSINSNPPALSWDEVSIGYNAYSILKTGKDEHGKFFPLDTFVAYGDYKPPLSIYLTVPFVQAFGLHELSVRLPSAIFGTFSVLLLFLITKEFVDRMKKFPGNSYLPIIVALLFTFSPWHINLSRAGFESNISLGFILLGLYLYFLSQRHKHVYIIMWLPFVAALYTFNSSRYFAPLLALPLLSHVVRSFRVNFRQKLFGVVIASIALMPIIPHLLSKEARLRYEEVNIFSDASIVADSNKRIEESGNAWWAKIVFNRRVGYTRSFLLHFFDHFQPDFLFIKGDGNPKFSIQDVGQLYSIEAPFLVIGAVALLVDAPMLGMFLLYWLLFALLPASVARETPHALRILNSAPVFYICIGYGIVKVYGWIQGAAKDKKEILKNSFIMLVGILYAVNILYYLHNYHTHYPKEYSGEWQYGYKQALSFVHPRENQYDHIFMTESIGRPYMYMLFYTAFDPNRLFTSKKSYFDAVGFYHVDAIGKYIFGKEIPQVCEGKCLFVVPAGGEVKDGKLLETIRLLNGNPILLIYEK